MNSSQTFRGIFTAIITPFKREQIDYEGLEELIESQIRSNVNGIVAAGSTGEAHSLSHLEYLNLIKRTVEIIKGRVPLVVGIPDCSTSKIIEVITLLKNSTIEAFLVAAPYYVRPQQQGILEHYKEIIKKTNAKIIVYNIPSRCSVNIDNSTMLKIMDLPGIVAVKDASGDLECPSILKAENDRIPILSGSDTTYAAHRINGGDGTISALSNLIPDEMLALERAINKGEYEKIRSLHKLIFPLSRAIFHETNPVSLKYALSCLKKDITPTVRLPLIEATNSTKQLIHETLKAFEVEKTSAKSAYLFQES